MLSYWQKNVDERRFLDSLTFGYNKPLPSSFDMYNVSPLHSIKI